MNEQTVQEGKTFAFVAYLTLLGTLVAFFMNQDRKNEFTSHHTRQGLGLGLMYLIFAYFIGGFDSWLITTSFWIFFLVLYFYGMLGALTGKLNTLPIIGEFFQKLFKSIGQ